MYDYQFEISFVMEFNLDAWGRGILLAPERTSYPLSKETKLYRMLGVYGRLCSFAG